MACSKYEYVKHFETSLILLPSTFIVIRLDGKAFTRFADLLSLEKPNDFAMISLMNKCAEEVMKNFSEIWLAYGQSDEFSFVLRQNTTFFNRRSEKISSVFASCFSSVFVMNFPKYFPSKKLQAVPIFDARCVLYPSLEILRHYLSWRQADCHINNLYNTCFWMLVEKKGVTRKEAGVMLNDMKADQKNELLWSFGVNYNKVEEVYRKGSILIRRKVENRENNEENIEENEENKEEKGENEEKTDKIEEKIDKIDKIREKEEKTDKIRENEETPDKRKKDEKIKEANPKEKSSKKRRVIAVLHEDLISDPFWSKYKEDLDYS